MSAMTEHRETISICIITYNHAKYIDQCIRSVLNQKCSDNLEIVLGDDASTDETVSIARSVLASRDIHVKIIEHKVNVGVKANLESTLRASSGAFVALLEGDDYWVDPLKLTKQVTRLRENRAAALDVTAAAIDLVVFGHRKIYKPPVLSNRGMELNEAITRGWFGLHTCTYVMTREFLKKHLESTFFQRGLLCADWPIAVHAALEGPIIYSDEYTAVYRIAPGSLMNSDPYIKARLVSEQREWWKIFKEATNNPDVQNFDVESSISKSMKQIGFNECGDATAKKKTFEISNARYILAVMRRRLSLFKMWLLGVRADLRP